MNSGLEGTKEGWMSVRLALRPDEIDVLISRLQTLKAGGVGHFHFVQERWIGVGGIAHVEISVAGLDQTHDMRIC